MLVWQLSLCHEYLFVAQIAHVVGGLKDMRAVGVFCIQAIIGWCGVKEARHHFHHDRAAGNISLHAIRPESSFPRIFGFECQDLCLT